jgi:O-antigen/teichoic acid export membrane protein
VILLARTLGPEKQGIIAILIASQQILTLLFDFGVSSAKTYYVSSGLLDISRAQELELRLISIITFFISVVILLVYFMDLSIFKGIELHNFVLLGITVIISILSGWALSVPLSFQNYDTYNLAMLSQSISYAIVISVTAFLSFLNMDAILVAIIISNIVSMLIARMHCEVLVKPERSIQLRDLVRYGSHNVAADIITMGNYRASYFACNSFLGAAETGIYALSVSLMEKLWVVSQSITTIYLPKLAADSNGGVKSKTIMLWPALLVMAITFMLGLVLLLFIFFFSDAVFGNKYHRLAEVALALFIGIVAWSGVRVIAVQYAAFGMPIINLIVTSFCLLANILQLFFYSNISVNRLAIITSTSYLVALIFIILFSVIYNEKIHFKNRLD